MKSFIAVSLFCTVLFGADLDWSHDYEKTREQAQKSGKNIYVLISSDSCQWCRKFEETTLEIDSIKKRLYSEFEVVLSTSLEIDIVCLRDSRHLLFQDIIS